MNSKPEPQSYELLRLEAIAEELHRLADEATERWRAAVARAEGTPLLDRLKGKARK